MRRHPNARRIFIVKLAAHDARLSAGSLAPSIDDLAGRVIHKGKQ